MLNSFHKYLFKKEFDEQFLKLRLDGFVKTILNDEELENYSWKYLENDSIYYNSNFPFYVQFYDENRTALREKIFFNNFDVRAVGLFIKNDNLTTRYRNYMRYENGLERQYDHLIDEYHDYCEKCLNHCDSLYELRPDAEFNMSEESIKIYMQNFFLTYLKKDFDPNWVIERNNGFEHSEYPIILECEENKPRYPAPHDRKKIYVSINGAKFSNIDSKNERNFSRAFLMYLEDNKEFKHFFQHQDYKFKKSVREEREGLVRKDISENYFVNYGKELE